jgi:hypothetical protein
MGYAQVNYDSQSGTFTPFGSGDKCGAACRAIVAAKDSVFRHTREIDGSRVERLASLRGPN